MSILDFLKVARGSAADFGHGGRAVSNPARSGVQPSKTRQLLLEALEVRAQMSLVHALAFDSTPDPEPPPAIVEPAGEPAEAPVDAAPADSAPTDALPDATGEEPLADPTGYVPPEAEPPPDESTGAGEEAGTLEIGSIPVITYFFGSWADDWFYAYGTVDDDGPLTELTVFVSGGGYDWVCEVDEFGLFSTYPVLIEPMTSFTAYAVDAYGNESAVASFVAY
jgi:hypothetical protein